MSSNHTPNYNLSQWERSDQVLMDDFNADNAKIDAALNALSRTADTLSAAVSKHTSSLNSQSSSIARLGNCAVCTLTYSGAGAASRTVTFPGYPVFALVRGTGGTGYLAFFRGATTPITPFSADPNYPATWGANSLTWSASSANAAFNSTSTNYLVFALLDMSK